MTDPWQVLDDWAKQKSETTANKCHDHLKASKPLNDPCYRMNLGEHRAFQRLRSFIHTHRNNP